MWRSCIQHPGSLGLENPPRPRGLAKGLWTWKEIWKVLAYGRRLLSMARGDVSLKDRSDSKLSLCITVLPL